MKDQEMKYNASLHIAVNDPAKVEFIGKVQANSIKDLKEVARKHARSWNKHLYGRIHLEDADQGLEFFINP